MFPPLFLNIDNEAQQNKKFRKVIYESKIMRVVVMTLKKDQEIGDEMHTDEDQFLKVKKGLGIVILDNCEQELNKGDAIIIPKGTIHNFRNIGDTPLKMYSIYSKVYNPYTE